MIPLPGLTGWLLQCEGPWELGQQDPALRPSPLRPPRAPALPCPARSLPMHTSLAGPHQLTSVHCQQGCACCAPFSLLRLQALSSAAG